MPEEETQVTTLVYAWYDEPRRFIRMPPRNLRTVILHACQRSSFTLVLLLLAGERERTDSWALVT